MIPRVTGLFLLLVLWLAPSLAANADVIRVLEKEDQLVISVVEGEGSLSSLLEACRPFFEFELYYHYSEVANRRLPWNKMTTSRSELWGDLQALLLANDLAWIWLDASTILLKNHHTAQQLTSWARNAPLEEAVQRRLPQAEIVTVAVPLQYLDARATFGSMRSYFTNQSTQSITPIDESNSLVMTAFGCVIERHVALIHELDRPSRKADSHELRLYPLEHANLDYVLRDVEEFLQQRQAPRTQATSSSSEPREVVLPVDERNALIVWGRPETLAQLDALIPLLDQEQDSDGEESKEEPGSEKQAVLTPVELPSDKALEKSLEKYFEARDEGRSPLKLEKMSEIVGRLLEKAARRNGWDVDRSDRLSSALAHTDWLRGPMSRFPDTPKLSSRRLVRSRKESEARYWLSVPSKYQRDEFWPTLLILLGEEAEDERLWLERFRERHAELANEAVLLVPERPIAEDSVLPWSSEAGADACLAALENASWDHVRMDLDRVVMVGGGTASRAAARIAAQQTHRFAALAIEQDLPAEPWQLNLTELPTLAPSGTYIAAQTRRPGSEVKMLRDWPADLSGLVRQAWRSPSDHLVRLVPDPSFGAAGWVEVLELAELSEKGDPAVFEARLERHDNVVLITCQGIDRLSLHLNDEQLDLDRPVTVRVNDREVFQGQVTRSLAELLSRVYETGERRRLYSSRLEIAVP